MQVLIIVLLSVIHTSNTRHANERPIESQYQYHEIQKDDGIGVSKTMK